ncbi:hypothetical protein GR212_15450 [Rhizobium lusitanum]|uniref:H-NS histone family protein n=1 Tax=Rhizobium lusitanum TaxID=293958 RepID=A0A6L9U4V3_9HYPH|nr:hypothetical protein [Rhizobium lusitanum]NEI70975.1 hypothetical protein [Rhizobium lusitanum]
MAILEEKKKIEVTDIEKLRPELLELSVNEIDRKIAELMMAKEKKAAIEAEKQREIDLQIAQTAFDNMIDAFQVLNGLGRLPDRIKAVLTSEDGSFQPGRYLKKPRT